MKFIVRDVPPRVVWTLEKSGIHPMMARLFAGRGVVGKSELDDSLSLLLSPTTLKGASDAARQLADAIEQKTPICILADYDCDGATACAVGVRGLRMLGASAVSFMVPNRVLDGYGLTAAISERVAQSMPAGSWLITVDNGISSCEGVTRAQELGLRVLITDHHLSGQELPSAQAIVNPNQPGCPFESKSLAGVGVMFYVLVALRSELRTRGAFSKGSEPRLDSLLPLVALGTVADVVTLDANNRRLVAQGLKRIHSGHAQPGLLALMEVTQRKIERINTFDLGFALGPRLNAAGRLADMTLGIELLLTDDRQRAKSLALQLDAINKERRTIESKMREQANTIVTKWLDEKEANMASTSPNSTTSMPAAIAVFDSNFHEGVVGLVASRLKDRWHRPTFVFARGQSDDPDTLAHLKGSGRSIVGFHLRDALDLIAKRYPDLILRFGGHAMAAGCTIRGDGFETFNQALTLVAQEWLDPSTLLEKMETDGPLPVQYRRADFADILGLHVWGQGFAAPVFSESMEVVSQRLVGPGHMQLRLRHHGEVINAIWFGRTQPLPSTALLAFRLESDEWQGQKRVRFFIEGMQT